MALRAARMPENRICRRADTGAESVRGVEGEGGQLISTVVTQEPFSRFLAHPHNAALYKWDLWDPGLFRGWVTLADQRTFTNKE